MTKNVGPRYAELHAHSAFSFLDGASLPADLAAEAAAQGLSALAITDHDGLYGAVQLSQAVATHQIAGVYGAELTLSRGATHRGPSPRDPDPVGDHLVVLARNPTGYRKLSAAIARGYLRTGEQGKPTYDLPELARMAGTDWRILSACRKGRVRRALGSPAAGLDVEAAIDETRALIDLFGRDQVAIEVTHHGQPHDAALGAALARVAHATRIDLVATGNVHYARPRDAHRAHVLAAVRTGQDLATLDGWLPMHGQAYIHSPAEMARLHRDNPHAVVNAYEIGRECSFDFHLIAPKLPPFPTPPGHDEASLLRELVERAAPLRYGTREDPRVPGAWEQIDKELDVICTLGFPGYFLIVHQIMEFCRARGILAQGRGSAANSAVCFVLGITAVDAVRYGLLFERFLSTERDGPPDIDIDIESSRREEVIQDLYQRYGREHAAQVANVITYRPKMAVRDAAKAFGFDSGLQDAWSKGIERHVAADGSGKSVIVTPQGVPEPVRQMADELLRLPRHLGIHSGGMVLCDRPVIEVCPVQWAATAHRTVVQWDKEDCADAGLVKFDLLGLGMLTALRLMFESVAAGGGPKLTLYDIPAEDPAVYDLLCAADTVGVFQVESRAQMSTLPRLRPRTFYDLVVEVALIRPGPIQGGSVHPYIERRRAQREGRLPPDSELYAHPLLKPALERTLGVPLFQEQLMQMAVDAAGFTPSQADVLRRAMGSKRSKERMEGLRGALYKGMAQRGIDPATREEIYHKLEAFADFGFPESHSFSFAFLVYASSWMKVYHPAAFYAGLLAAQPMGFYSPQSLAADARRHGVKVLRPCVNQSQEDACVEVLEGGQKAVRLGLTQVRSLSRAGASRIVQGRGPAYRSIADVARRARLGTKELEGLAGAGAFAALGVDRRTALWSAGVASLEVQGTLPGLTDLSTQPRLPAMVPIEVTEADVSSTGVSVASFPTQFARVDLQRNGVLPVAEVVAMGVAQRATVAGVVTHRQRPNTARGITFLSLEDETGLLNVVCSAGLWQRFGKVVMGNGALVIRGYVENDHGAVNLVAEHVRGLRLSVPTVSRNFR
ncbi:error-prone DNA polymerase [Rarobacter incanus]|uniref:Error-prone DNA polymerase n=1 Tax=Rarobacter incanus TaxID=153494 RepID=A0A542SMB5_9MICO|nr:error-prone DNA polymerase [Rarobacter incanus]TQK75770.1 DnaE-like error-prone DNA polymerase [Rarobacter incanus]